MKKLITILFLINVQVLFSQPAFELEFSVSSNTGQNAILTIGLDNAALEGFDSLDLEGPPPPPIGGFDAWFEIPGFRLIKDIKQGALPYSGVKLHSLKFQAPTGATSIDITFNLPDFVSVNIKDAVSNGLLLDETFLPLQPGSLSVTNLALNNLNVTVTYDGLLPVELNSFTGRVSGKSVNLHWETATEINNYGFEIEKQYSEFRNQNSEWKLVGFVKGAGNSNSPKQYSFSDKIKSAGKFKYRLKQIDNDGSYVYSDAIELTINLPSEFKLDQNYPNPFNPSTTIDFTIPQSGFVNLTIYNSLGEEAAVLINKNFEEGSHSVKFDASKLQSGVYFYKLSTNDYSTTKKMMLIK